MTSRFRTVNKIHAGYIGTFGQDEGRHEAFLIGAKGQTRRIEVYPPYYDRPEWSVIYDGAVDFEGTKKELIRRYPELKEHHKRRYTTTEPRKVKIGMRMFNI